MGEEGQRKKEKEVEKMNHIKTKDQQKRDLENHDYLKMKQNQYINKHININMQLPSHRKASLWQVPRGTSSSISKLKGRKSSLNLLSLNVNKMHQQSSQHHYT